MRFKPVDGAVQGTRVRIEVDGRPLMALDGQTLAMALLESAAEPFRRTAVSHAARAPLCLMGVCFDCLAEVDGKANVQSCMVKVHEGMKVRRQQGARSPEIPK